MKYIFLLFLVENIRCNVVVVLMLNGFNEDLLKYAPNMRRLRSEGFSGKVFPTFPYENEPINFSFATGLDPNLHGVVANHFYDHRDGELFYTQEKFYKHFDRVAPLWSFRGDRAFCVDWHGSQFDFHRQKCRQAQKVIIIICFDINQHQVLIAGPNKNI